MNTWGVAIAFAIAAAGFHGVAAVVQNRLADTQPTRQTRPSMLGMMLQRRWWLAIGLTVLAACLHVTALHFGPLTVVQPLGVLSLAFALALSAALTGHRVTGSQWRGLAMSMAGLGCIVVLTSSGRPKDALSSAEVTTLAIATAVTVIAAVVFGMTLTLRPVRRSLLYAAAAGMTFGVSSALTQTLTIRVAESGMSALPTPTTAVVIGFAVTGLLLAHTAFRAGLGAPLAAATIVNPVVAAVIGIGLLGERFTGGPIAVTVAVIAGPVAAWGVVLLAKGSRAVAPKAMTAELLSTRL